MRYGAFGIHTRLQFVIDKTGGIDWDLRSEYLAKKYCLPIEKMRQVCKIDVEEYLDTGMSIDELIEKYRKYRDNKRKKSEQAFENMTTMLATVAGLGESYWMR